jgi:hypothetical protein
MAGKGDVYGLAEDCFPYPILINNKNHTFLVRQSAVKFISESKYILAITLRVHKFFTMYGST